MVKKIHSEQPLGQHQKRLWGIRWTLYKGVAKYFPVDSGGTIRNFLFKCGKSLRASHSFLCVPKERKRRVVCATPLRKGSRAPETIPRPPRPGTGGAKTRLKLKQFAPSSGPGPRRPAQCQWPPLSPNIHLTVKNVPAGRTFGNLRNSGWRFADLGDTICNFSLTVENPCGLPILKRSAVWSAPHRYERAAVPLSRSPRPGIGGGKNLA
jgi:hypothetical protein